MVNLNRLIKISLGILLLINLSFATDHLNLADAAALNAVTISATESTLKVSVASGAAITDTEIQTFMNKLKLVTTMQVLELTFDQQTGITDFTHFKTGIEPLKNLQEIVLSVGQCSLVMTSINANLKLMFKGMSSLTKLHLKIGNQADAFALSLDIVDAFTDITELTDLYIDVSKYNYSSSSFFLKPFYPLTKLTTVTLVCNDNTFSNIGTWSNIFVKNSLLTTVTLGLQNANDIQDFAPLAIMLKRLANLTSLTINNQNTDTTKDLTSLNSVFGNRQNDALVAKIYAKNHANSATYEQITLDFTSNTYTLFGDQLLTCKKTCAACELNDQSYSGCKSCIEDNPAFVRQVAANQDTYSSSTTAAQDLSCNCPSGFFNSTPNHSECSPCLYHCATCSNGTTCDTCQPLRTKNSNLCTTCDNGYFNVNNMPACQACGHKFQTCKQDSASTSPKPMVVTTGDPCSHNTRSGDDCICGAGTFDDGVNAECQSCSAGLVYREALTCPCPDHFYDDTKNLICQACDVKCNKCVTSATNCIGSTDNTSDADRCSDHATDNKRDHTDDCNCPAGYYIKQNDPKCYACASGCATCKDQTECLTFSDCSNTSMMPPLCTTLKDTGYFTVWISEGTYADKQCASQCLTCNENKKNCASCAPGRQDNPPYCSCPEGQVQKDRDCVELASYCNDNVTNCATCNIKTLQCIECNTGYEMFNGLCQENCGEGKYRDYYGICQTCLYYKEQCVEECPEDTTLNSSSKKCVENAGSSTLLVVFIIFCALMIIASTAYSVMITMKSKKNQQVYASPNNGISDVNQVYAKDLEKSQNQLSMSGLN